MLISNSVVNENILNIPFFGLSAPKCLTIAYQTYGKLFRAPSTIGAVTQTDGEEVNGIPFRKLPKLRLYILFVPKFLLRII